MGNHGVVDCGPPLRGQLFHKRLYQHPRRIHWEKYDFGTTDDHSFPIYLGQLILGILSFGPEVDHVAGVRLGPIAPDRPIVNIPKLRQNPGFGFGARLVLVDKLVQNVPPPYVRPAARDLNFLPQELQRVFGVEQKEIADMESDSLPVEVELRAQSTGRQGREVQAFHECH